jgi:hypothetical protein
MSLFYHVKENLYLVIDLLITKGVLTALSAMINLSLPHITVLSKCDLVSDR